jgi:cytochrome c
LRLIVALGAAAATLGGALVAADDPWAGAGDAAARQMMRIWGGTPEDASTRDQTIWKREEKKWVDEGYKAFHSSRELGGTVGVSCDMCHPDASNTHPETYPKYQVPLKKVALLRDMVNWCIENALKGKPLPENDPRLRAVEAYITTAHKGVAIEPGKH